MTKSMTSSSKAKNPGDRPLPPYHIFDRKSMANKHIFDGKFRLSPHIFDRTLKIGAGHVPCSFIGRSFTIFRRSNGTFGTILT